MVEAGFSDNGPGMSDELIARAFEPFFTTKPPGTGTGLGLWTSYQVVEALGGSITIESVLGKGTTLKLRLPKCEIDAAPKST